MSSSAGKIKILLRRSALLTNLEQQGYALQLPTTLPHLGFKVCLGIVSIKTNFAGQDLSRE